MYCTLVWPYANAKVRYLYVDYKNLCNVYLIVQKIKSSKLKKVEVVQYNVVRTNPRMSSI
jgi:hypothetical protein